MEMSWEFLVPIPLHAWRMSSASICGGEGRGGGCEEACHQGKEGIRTVARYGAVVTRIESRLIESRLVTRFFAKGSRIDEFRACTDRPSGGRRDREYR